MADPVHVSSDAESAILPTYIRADVAFERGEGAWLTATDGSRWLDFGAGIAVAGLGHSHPHVLNALKEQGEKLWHVSNLYKIPQAEKLAHRLADATFADYVFFTNSGAEALEGAIKTARKYQFVSGHPERVEIITFDNAFHGRTLATIAAGGQKKYLEGFGPKVEGFDQVAFGDIEVAKKAVGPETAAILIEPVQGEGGIRVAPTQFLKDLRELCDKEGLLLLFDEVQCGVGRTGKLFAYEWAGIEPDVMAIAKGIGGGFPVGACLATAEAASGMTAGVHGTTFGGNPLAMAVGNAVLDVILEPGFLEAVQRKGLALKQSLASVIDEFPSVFEEIRGTGLLLGLKCKVPNGAANAAFRDQNLLTVPGGDNVVRLLPPLTVTDDEIRLAVERIRTGAATLAAASGNGKA